jgi:hypothetical protein
MKIVVFDLDETLGYFTQFGIFCDCLNNYLTNQNLSKITQSQFNFILDLYPEFLRPNIINILNYLKNKKKTKCCHKMMIYTNNTGPKEWAHSIISYFEKKINYKIIDQIISAFRVNGKRVEICRTTHDKTHKDFIKCTKIPDNAEICFLDDSYYPEMANNNIYYINLKPYFHDIVFKEMLGRFTKSDIGVEMIHNDELFTSFMLNKIEKYNYDCVLKDEKEYEIDVILGKHVMVHLEDFFSVKNKNKTKKHQTNKRNKTIRNY